MGGGVGRYKSVISNLSPTVSFQAVTLDKYMKNQNKNEIKSEKITDELNDNIEKLKKKVFSDINLNEKKIPWFFNNHGKEHIEKVEKNIEEVISKYSDISITKESLGRQLNKYEQMVLNIAGILHDIGRNRKPEKGHSIASYQEILKMKNLIPHKETRQLIAKLALLHNRSGIKYIGGKNLPDLIKKGIISKREAFLSKILSNADALHAGKSRVLNNTQGENRKTVISRIEKSKKFSESRKLRYLAHWIGHSGFYTPVIKKTSDNIGIQFRIDPTKLKKGSIVAARISDVVRSFSKTRLSKSSKNRLTLILKCSDEKILRNFVHKNKYVLEQYSDNIKLK